VSCRASTRNHYILCSTLRIVGESMEEKTEQINLKITWETRQQLEAICRYEGVGMAELIRGWIRDRLAEYKKAKSTKDLLKAAEMGKLPKVRRKPREEEPERDE